MATVEQQQSPHVTDEAANGGPALMRLHLASHLELDYDRSNRSSDQPSTSEPTSSDSTHRYVNVDYAYEQTVFDSATSTPNTTTSNFTVKQVNTPSRTNKVVDKYENSENTPTIDGSFMNTPSLQSFSSANSNTGTTTSGSRFLAIRNWLKPNRWRKSKDKSSATTTPTKYVDSPLSTSLQTGTVDQSKLNESTNRVHQAPETPLVPSARTKTSYYTSPFQIFNSLDSKSKKSGNNQKAKKSKSGKKSESSAEKRSGGVGMSTICVANSTIINTLFASSTEGYVDGVANSSVITATNALNNGSQKSNGTSLVLAEVNTVDSNSSLSSPNPMTKSESNLSSAIYRIFF
jgi:hypothetical protein